MKKLSIHCAAFLPILFIALFTSCSKNTPQPELVAADISIEKSGNAYLIDNGIAQGQLCNIARSSANQLNEIAKTNRLNSEQTKAMLNSYIQIQHKTSETGNIVNKTILPNKNITNSIFLMEELNSTKNAANRTQSCTVEYISKPGVYQGAHWMIRSNSGYNMASGFITLPTVGTYSANDRPYMFFGGYTTNGALCSDAGVVYFKEFNKWLPFINLNIWNSDSVKYIPEWTSYLSDEINISNPYISYKVSNVGNHNRFELIVINPATWTVIASDTTNSLSPKFNNKKPVSNNYTNLQMTRETSLAQTSENLLNGSYMLHAKWNSVYLYNDSGYGLWDCSVTTEAGKADNPDHWSKIAVNSYTVWSADDISISYY